ncbi:hypothetical protein Pint_00189 [Pistacia integerrima]|uniref:Uncharacterized protein n=1 Tax=Pistacia integerrima TaxID=434235 RepID=A0ACC0ZL55_9ROSI|nr:hypothetical protein Pint_00189 [Pistacia integerrima]
MSLGRRNNEVRGVGKPEAPKLKFRVGRVTVGIREDKKRVRSKLQSRLCPLHHNFPSLGALASVTLASVLFPLDDLFMLMDSFAYCAS